MITLKSQLLQTVKIIALAIIFTLIISTVSAEPTAYPPAGNVAAPVNVGTSAQIKNGGLGLNALSVFGSQYIQEKLGIGNSTPATTLDVTGDTTSDRFCLGSSCISAWSQAGSQTTSIDWSNITNKPAGFADNIDNEGSTTSIDWNNVTNKPSGFADNVDNVGIDEIIGSCRWVSAQPPFNSTKTATCASNEFMNGIQSRMGDDWRLISVTQIYCCDR